MYRDSTTARILTITLIAVLLLISGGSALALADDLLRRDVMPTGASIDGNPVGGLSRANAAALVEEKVKGALLAPATIRFRDRSFQLDPSGYVSVDVEGMLDTALAPRTDAPVYARVLARLTGAPVGTEVKTAMKIDEAKLGAWIASIEPQVALPAVDASLSVTTGMLRIIPEAKGAAIDTSAAPQALLAGLLEGSKDIALPVRSIEPSLTLATMGKTIFVKLRTRRLYLYQGDQLEKEFGVAIGTPAYPTPKGEFKIINKRRNPTWSNPGSGWAASMPSYIGPGPGNPLGTRALYLNSPGIRIHGTTKDYSIGTAASHGCMRMHRSDIEDLFERVPIGTRVIIVG
jgi:lipoprotein-anchoring transpeptidase ErfK/SrfK